MRAQRRRPRGGGTILEPITAADDSLQVRTRVLGERLRKRVQRVGDDGAAGGAEAVVVELEDAEGARGGEEGDERVDGAPAERVVAQVDLDERRLVDQRVADGGERGRDLRDQAAGEDVGEVRDLAWARARLSDWVAG